MSHDERAACACDNWICPHNEEKIKHLPGVVKGIALLKQRVEDMRQYWQEAEKERDEARAEVVRIAADRLKAVGEANELRAELADAMAKVGRGR